MNSRRFVRMGTQIINLDYIEFIDDNIGVRTEDGRLAVGLVVYFFSGGTRSYWGMDAEKLRELIFRDN